MTEKMGPVVISGRLAELERVASRHTYRLSTWSPSLFGVDESLSGTASDSLLKGYVHALVAVEDVEDVALGLLPPEESLPAYVEVDEMSDPLPASERGLEAVLKAEHLIRGEGTDTGDLLDRIVQLACYESASLRVALFEVLREHMCGEGPSKIEALPHRLFHLLPWEVFDLHLDRLADLTGGSSDSVLPMMALPDLSSHFVYVRRSLSHKTTTLVNHIAMGAPSDTLIHSASVLLSTLDSAKLERLPPTTRRRLIRGLDSLGNAFLKKRLLPHLEPNSIEKAQATIAQCNQVMLRLRNMSADVGQPSLRAMIQVLDKAITKVSTPVLFPPPRLVPAVLSVRGVGQEQPPLVGKTVKRVGRHTIKVDFYQVAPGELSGRLIMTPPPDHECSLFLEAVDSNGRIAWRSRELQLTSRLPSIALTKIPESLLESIDSR